MPSKKKKYNARFPAGRIKKIMQSDEEIGKVAQAVPIIISRTLELFVDSLLTKTVKITNLRNAKTLSTSHMKQCIMSEQRFDFLRELVKNIPDISVAEETAGGPEVEEVHSSPEATQADADSDVPYDLSMPSTSNRASRIYRANGGGGVVVLNPHSSNGGSGETAREVEAPRAHLKREATRWQRPAGSYRLSADDSSSNETATSSKYCRSDSMSTIGGGVATAISTTSTSLTHCGRGRLKHQSHSVPCDSVTAIRQQSSTSSQHTSPAIPNTAPIVSFDFCSKPIVKIEYSHQPAASQVSATTAITALPHANATATTTSNSQRQSSLDDVVGSPIINIDLSNIVADAAGRTTGSDTPMAATISIGPPLPAITTTTPVRKEQLSHSLSLGTATASKSIKSFSGATSYLELDEDYDDI